MPALALAALLGALALAPRGAALAAEPISVEARWRGEALEVVCRALVEAPQELVWQTLTDYDRLAEFIPGMRRSRVTARRGPETQVEQSGEAAFLFVSVPIEVTVAATERPPRTLEVRMLKGNLRRLEGAYTIEPDGAAGGVRLSWRGLIQAESLPPLIGEMVLRSTIEDQFRGMLREIERREALRRARLEEPAR